MANMDKGNLDARVNDPLKKITGPLVGELLLESFKAAMIEEPVFQMMFGKKGERIFINELPNYNDTIVPLLELYWKNERFEDHDLYFSGVIDARLVLPLTLAGPDNLNKLRRVAGAFQRFIGADQHRMFDREPGLTEFGFGMDFTFNQLLKFSGQDFPVIPFTIPFKYDLAKFRELHPEIDLQGRLDEEEFGWITSYSLKVLSEEGEVLIAQGTLSKADSKDG